MATKITLDKFAKLLGISKRTLYRYIEKGWIENPKESANGKKYFTNEDIMKYDDILTKKDFE